MQHFNEWLLIRESEGGEEEVAIMQHATELINDILTDYEQKVSAQYGDLSSQHADLGSRYADLNNKHQFLSSDFEKMKGEFEKSKPKPTLTPEPKVEVEPPAPAAAGPGKFRRALGGIAGKIGSALDTTGKDNLKLKPNSGMGGLRDTLGGWLKGAASRLRGEGYVDLEGVEAAILEYIVNENPLLVENEELNALTTAMRTKVMGVLQRALQAMHMAGSASASYMPPKDSSLKGAAAKKLLKWHRQREVNPEFAEPQPVFKRNAKKITSDVENHMKAQKRPGIEDAKVHRSWFG
jgi:hypothetical protein